MKHGREPAEALARDVLVWILGQEDVLPQFLTAGGLSPDELRARIDDPAFLAAVLDFLLTDDALIRGFCDAEGLGYDRPLAARRLLPGGASFDWG